MIQKIKGELFFRDILPADGPVGIIRFCLKASKWKDLWKIFADFP